MNILNTKNNAFKFFIALWISILSFPTILSSAYLYNMLFDNKEHYTIYSNINDKINYGRGKRYYIFVQDWARNNSRIKMRTSKEIFDLLQNKEFKVRLNVHRGYFGHDWLDMIKDVCYFDADKNQPSNELDCLYANGLTWYVKY